MRRRRRLFLESIVHRSRISLYALRPIIEHKAHVPIERVRFCPSQRPNKALIDTKSLGRTQNRPHIAPDNLIIVLPRTRHAISGHFGFNDHGPQLLPEIISLGPRPAKEVANAVVAFKGVKALDGLFEAVERRIKAALQLRSRHSILASVPKMPATKTISAACPCVPLSSK